LGIVNAFDMPVRQAFTIEMIEKKEDLSNAIALNSSMVNLARLVGPAVAGMLIAFFGEGLCFLLNAASYLAVLYSLVLMKVVPRATVPAQGNIFSELKEGFQYVFGFIPIRYILMLVALVSLMGVPYQVLMPIFVKDIFLRGPQTLGFLMGIAGVGALTGVIYLAGRKTVLGLGRVIARAAGVFGLGLVLFSWSRVLWLSMALAFVAGMGMMVQMASSNIILQTITDENKRGRVMSFYTMAFMGTAPFGSLFAGITAHWMGAPLTLTMGGLACLAGAVMFWRKLPSIKSEIRPVYMKKGIIAEATAGISYK
jgi:MFS family permease